jgi:glycerol-3-phosphate O-acyltransferase
LTAQQSDRPTHFYPLALKTYDLLPPPEGVNKTIGEARHTKATPIWMGFGKEIDMENFPGSEIKDKRQRRQLRAKWIWDKMNEVYEKLGY